MKLSVSGWDDSLGTSLPLPFHLRSSTFCAFGSEPDERAWRLEGQVTVSESLAVGQGRGGGLTIHAVLMAGMASRRTIPCYGWPLTGIGHNITMSNKEHYSHTQALGAHVTCFSRFPPHDRTHLETSLSTRQTPGNRNNNPRPVSCIVIEKPTFSHIENVIFMTFSSILFHSALRQKPPNITNKARCPSKFILLNQEERGVATT